MQAQQAIYQSIKKSYSKFGIFFFGRRLTRWGLLDCPIFILRRVIFVVSALYMVDQVFAAFAIFMLSSYLKLTYIISVKPFDSIVMVQTEAFNELTVLLVGYAAFLLVDKSLGRD